MPLSITCPGCREPLDVDEEYRTWKVRCPRCDTEFVPDDQRPARPPRPTPPPPPRRVRDEDEDDRPRRRRRRRYDRADYDEAASEVYGPGLGLELLGWLGVLASLGLALLFVLAVLAPQPGGQANREEAIVALLFGGCVGVFGVGLSAVLIVGGRHTRRLTSRPWATGAAVLCLLSMGVLHLAVGLWAIIVINRPHVQAAFEYQARHGGPPDEYGDDD